MRHRPGRIRGIPPPRRTGLVELTPLTTDKTKPKTVAARAIATETAPITGTSRPRPEATSDEIVAVTAKPEISTLDITAGLARPRFPTTPRLVIVRTSRADQNTCSTFTEINTVIPKIMASVG